MKYGSYYDSHEHLYPSNLSYYRFCLKWRLCHHQTDTHAMTPHYSNRNTEPPLHVTCHTVSHAPVLRPLLSLQPCEFAALQAISTAELLRFPSQYGGPKVQ